MIRISIDEPTSVGLNVDINVFQSGGPLSDADIVSLAQVILASDAVQNSPQWNGSPSLTSVTIDETRTLYPPA